jgi:REP element-mobilizing transposase RayT
VHVVVERHRRLIERIVGHLKTRAAQQLVVEGLLPFSHLVGKQKRFPSVWADRSWKVFLNCAEDVERAIGYVQQNPVKEGLKAQAWKFVV